MKLKKFFIIFLLIIFTILFSACANGTSSAIIDVTSSEEPTQNQIYSIPLKTGEEIRDILNTIVPHNPAGSVTFLDNGKYYYHLEAEYFEMNSSKPNAPQYYIDIEEKNIPVWYDSASKTIYYYVGGNQKLELNPDSSYMFVLLSNLYDLQTTHFDTSKVTDMSGMFYGCSSLTSLDVSNFNTENVTDMSYMFDGCSSISKLNLENFNTIKVTNMSNMFCNCLSLSNLNLTSFDTNIVTNMSSMFYACEKLTDLDLCTFNIKNVTDIRWMFCACKKLDHIFISSDDNWSVSHQISDLRMFDGCVMLPDYSSSKIDISYANGNSGGYFILIGPKSLKTGNEIIRIFSMLSPHASGRTAAILDNGKIFYYLTAEFFKKSNTRPENPRYYLDIAESNVPVWFDNSTNTIYYYIEENQTMELNPDSSYMFAVFSGIKEIETCDFDTSKVVDMSYMFYYCSNLTHLDVSNFNTENVTDMSSMFSGCSSIANLNLSNFNTNKVLNMSSMFGACVELSTLDLSNFNIKNVTDIRYMFYSCRNLNHIYISSNNNWSVSHEINSFRLFYDCKSLPGYSSSLEDINAAHVGTIDGITGYFEMKP